MLFNSFGYLLFILVAIPLAWALRGRARVWMLGLASLLFYAMWRWDFALLMLFSAMVDFVAAQRIDAAQTARSRRGWLITSLSINLGLLLVFKYTYFFSDSLVSVLAPFGYAGGGVRERAPSAAPHSPRRNERWRPPTAGASRAWPASQRSRLRWTRSSRTATRWASTSRRWWRSRRAPSTQRVNSGEPS